MDNWDLETEATRAGKRREVKAWRSSTDINCGVADDSLLRQERSKSNLTTSRNTIACLKEGVKPRELYGFDSLQQGRCPLYLLTLQLVSLIVAVALRSAQETRRRDHRPGPVGSHSVAKAREPAWRIPLAVGVRPGRVVILWKT